MSNPEPLGAPPTRNPPAAITDDPRVFLAAERTLLAWTRTGLAMMGFGFLVARFGVFSREISALAGNESAPTPSFSLWIGIAMVLLGVAASFFAGLEHVRFRRQLPTTPPIAQRRFVVSIAIIMLLAALGVGMAAYLVML